MNIAVERAAIAVRWGNTHSAAVFFGSMHLLYLDDAGSAANSNEEYFVLAGISVFEAQTNWFTQELDRLAQSIDPANPSEVEFHTSEIFSRRTEPWNLISLLLSLMQ